MKNGIHILQLLQDQESWGQCREVTSGRVDPWLLPVDDGRPLSYVVFCSSEGFQCQSLDIKP